MFSIEQCINVVPERAWGWSTIAKVAAGICLSNTPSEWPKQVSNPQSAASATATAVSIVLQLDGLTHATIDPVSLR